MSAPVVLNADNFDARVRQAAGPVVVDFWSQTCPHCLALAPQFEAAAQADATGATFATLRLQDAPALFAPHNVSGVPTLILFKGGQEVARRVGYAGTQQITEWVKEKVG